MIYQQNLHTQKNNHISKTPKILKFKLLNPPKLSEPTYIYIYKISEYPPPPPTHTHTLILVASGCEKRTLQKQDQGTDTNYN